MFQQIFNTDALKVQSIRRRVSDLDESVIMPLIDLGYQGNLGISYVAKKLHEAKENNSARILFIGGHVIRSGVQRYIIDLIDKGFITHVAMNGGAAIHDWEMSHYGATTESVDRYIKTGEFGLWDSLSKLNRIVSGMITSPRGLGYWLGETLNKGILFHCLLKNISCTVHIGIGCDLVCQLPNYDPLAWSSGSYLDFLLLARSCLNLENGVFINAGSAVFGPEIFLKALAMARNIAHQEGSKIEIFTTAVMDLAEKKDLETVENPHSFIQADHPSYYNRAFKNVLSRPHGGRCQGVYIQGHHRETFPALRSECLKFT